MQIKTPRSAQPKPKPVQELRLGAVKAAVWENRTEQGSRYNVMFRRLYKEKEQWKSSYSFGRDDLLVLAKLANESHTWICRHSQTQNPRQQPPDSPQPLDLAYE